MDRKRDLFEDVVYNEILTRIEKLTAKTQPLWGTMNSAQMLAHCAEVQEVGNGKELKEKSFVAKLFKNLIKKIVLEEKPYKRHSKTHPQYIISNKREFEKEKERLLKALEDFKKDHGPVRHSLFGELTTDERSWAMYKHLDHHLIQFGC